ncbi:MAG TPA: glycosyltransferase family 2 protein [Bacteroidia bacterium]|jgi:glycosyltransferase involved in cell wall biosynthesis|nr:glycosyltransferase family 2 protein [Bacteroidia bacterium]
MNERIDILLSTYNGEKFLRPQLDSLLRQDHENWNLLVRDDGSSDGTIAILEEYAQQYPDKIKLSTGESRLGFCGSFTKLLNTSSAAYIMFCDQDDIWNSDKISVMLEAIRKSEGSSPEKPCLVFGDLELMNDREESAGKIFLPTTGYRNTDGQQIFFLRNYVPGCNILFNRALLNKTLSTKNFLNLHDHWLLFTCAAIGTITCIPSPLMKYRIHPQNAIGIRNTSENYFRIGFKTILKYMFRNRAYREKLYSDQFSQALELGIKYKELLSGEATAFLNWNATGFLKRKIVNARKPFIREASRIKQLVYFFCF